MLTVPVQRIAGGIMLILVALLIIAFFTAQTPSTTAEDFPADFEDVVSDEELYLTGQAIQIAVGVLVAGLGAALYVLFRDRDRFMPLVGFTGFVLMAAMFVISSAFYITTHDLAQDLGREETIASESEVMEIGRAFVMLGDGLFFLALLFFAIGLLAFGAAILASRTAAAGYEMQSLAPPTWMGWVPVAAGILYLVGWLSLLTEWFFIAVIVAFILTLIWYAALGTWMLRASPGRAGITT